MTAECIDQFQALNEPLAAAAARSFIEPNDLIIPLYEVSPPRFGSGPIPADPSAPDRESRSSRLGVLRTPSAAARSLGAHNRLKDSADKLTRD